MNDWMKIFLINTKANLEMRPDVQNSEPPL